MRQNWTACFLFLLIFLCSCHDSAETDVPVDSNIIIEVREFLNNEGRAVTLYCQTEKIYPCVNYYLTTGIESTNDAYTISFTGVIEPVICLTALGPAGTVIELEHANNGSYTLELNNGPRMNTGKVEITDEKIVLDFDFTSGIDIAREITMRVPPNTYWGTIGYHTANSIDLANEFLDKLADAGADFNPQAPGHYFYYEIGQDGDILIDEENSGYYFVNGFIFQFEGNVSLLEDIVKQDGGAYFPDLYINMETYQGGQLNNWSN